MKVLLYPFLDQPGIAKYINIFKEWGKKGGCVFATPEDVTHKPLQYLLPVHGTHTVCVLGHCTAGGQYLRSQESYERKETGEIPGHTRRPDKLIELFKALGMPDNASIRLKCLNCHSGEHYDGDGGYFDEVASFATTLKMNMCNKGYGNVKVFGYIGELTLLPTPFPPKVPVRKFAIMATDKGPQAFRGKDLRYEITGNAVRDKEEEARLLEKIKKFDGDTGIQMD